MRSDKELPVEHILDPVDVDYFDEFDCNELKRIISAFMAHFDLKLKIYREHEHSERLFEIIQADNKGAEGE